MQSLFIKKNVFWNYNYNRNKRLGFVSSNKIFSFWRIALDKFPINKVKARAIKLGLTWTLSISLSTQNNLLHHKLLNMCFQLFTLLIVSKSGRLQNSIDKKTKHYKMAVSNNKQVERNGWFSFSYKRKIIIFYVAVLLQSTKYQNFHTLIIL